MKTFITSLALVWALFGTISASSTIQPNLIVNATSGVSTETAMKVIKVAAVELGTSVDTLWDEYNCGDCSITLVDSKSGTYMVLSAGGTQTTIVMVEGIF